MVFEVAIGTRDTTVGMSGCPPLRPWSTSVLLVALCAYFRSLGLFHRLETEDRPWLVPARLKMLAGRSMARLTAIIAMHIVFKRFNVCLVADFAERIVVDVSRPGNSGKRYSQRRIGRPCE